MNKIAQTLAAGALSAGFASATEAQPFRLDQINPNAVVEVLLRKIDGKDGVAGHPAPYAKSNDLSLMCLGQIKQDGVMVFDQKGRPQLYDHIVPEIAKFAYNPNAKDKAGQEKIRGVLESRSDLAYLEYDSTGGPDAKRISAYFTDVWHAAPIDVFQHGTGARDGSMRTTLLLDQTTLEKFAGANAAEIREMNDKHASDKISPSFSYSSCGPKSAP